MAKKQKSNTRGYRISWAQAVRDIVISSMNRGQLPILGCIAFAMFIIWKMPPKDVSKLAFAIVDGLIKGRIVGYGLFLLSLIGWYIHARIMRREFSKEAERIGLEKSELQNKAAGKQFKSSQ